MNIPPFLLSVRNLFILSVLRSFLSYIQNDIANVLGFNQMNCPWQSLMLSCRCSVRHVETFFSLIRQCTFFCMYNPIGKSQDHCLVIALVCFLHKILCSFSPRVKTIFWPTFFNSCLNFEPIFCILRNFVLFLKLFYFIFPVLIFVKHLFK